MIDSGCACWAYALVMIDKVFVGVQDASERRSRKEGELLKLL
jgi:hypothetical protein